MTSAISNICCLNPATCGSTGNGESAEEMIPALEKMFLESMSELPTLTPFEGEDATALAKLVFDSMTTSGRVYHSMQHVFDISSTMKDPILLLSALFHDIVYYSIDRAFSEEQTKYLEGLLECDTQQLTLASELKDELSEKFVKLYGFGLGEELPKSGTNEFLSGIIGVRALRKWLGMSHLMQIAACIEATIPFRPVIEGKSPMDRLYDRLKAVCPDQSEEWLVDTVVKSAQTANCDLCSFDSIDRDFFLDSSWKLLPEARPVLLKEDCPLIEMLYELNALEGRSNFLIGVVPRIFQSFRQVPSPEEMEEKQRRTHENLDIIRKYAKVRLLQVMTLIEFVEIMGEDPKSLPLRPCLMMDVPEVANGPSSSLTSVELEIRSWLVSGRRACFAWDPAISSLGAYLFDTLGTEGINEAVEVGQNAKAGSHDLLKYLPKSVVQTIASRLDSVLPDRAEGFLNVTEKLGILAQ
eukprot:CAMPEP_0117033124 /NCGR_PEP_ID=MMETSP0472-20121206/23697_1 /TAXON_ID=693140 ORGANISM="Tiarina fusus, Strain LIS" /NCGR_SAMPLE_ID=MMETSP0472 /ASSEMBLY_ACC=CAM_ASM_000603 /LENGTH=467 /DNA_ID=CAMNT_0004741965 /DNA_START=113 /DNA_END=1516 /DNA_ORIENTATION=+